MITRQEQSAPGCVIQDKGELAVQARYEIGSFLLVQVQQHLNIALCSEEMPPRLQTLAQFPEVEYLAIADNHNCTIFIIKRLITAGKIDNGQPPETETQVLLLMKPRIIRPTVYQGVGHGTQQRSFHPSLSPTIKNTGYSAHDSDTSVIPMLLRGCLGCLGARSSCPFSSWIRKSAFQNSTSLTTPRSY